MQEIAWGRLCKAATGPGMPWGRIVFQEVRHFGLTAQQNTRMKNRVRGGIYAGNMAPDFTTCVCIARKHHNAEITKLKITFYIANTTLKLCLNLKG